MPCLHTHNTGIAPLTESVRKLSFIFLEHRGRGLSYMPHCRRKHPSVDDGAQRLFAVLCWDSFFCRCLFAVVCAQHVYTSDEIGRG